MSGRFSAGLIEGACLTALIAVPLYFNPLSVRVFEPEKAALLRSLAVVVVVIGCVVVLGGTRRDETRAFWMVPAWSCARWRPVAVAVAFFVVTTLLSTACSITPRVSFWGSYVRLQGAYTTLAYVAIFAGLVSTIRTRGQVERVVLVMILTSLPVTLYAILQRLGMDPQSWGADATARVTSTLGNPIFLGGYLIMVFPLTLHEAAAALVARTRWRVPGPIAVLYLGVAGLQLLALGMSASRGPAVAWLVAMTFFLTLQLLVLGRRRLALGALMLVLLGGVAVVAVQIGGGPHAEALGLGRFGKLLDPSDATSRVRILVWEGVARLAAPHDPLAFVDGGEDRLNVVRPFVGHGPESLLVAFGRFYPPELGQVEDRDRLADRSHNETWDVLATGGLVGLAAYLGLVLAVVHLALTRLGLLAGRYDTRLLCGLCALGGALAAFGFVALAGRAFLGPAIPMGLVCGLFAHLGLKAATAAGAAPDPRPAHGDRSRVAALAAGVLAHFAETQVGIATVTSRLCFWSLVALMVCAGRTDSSPEAAQGTEGWVRGAVAWGLLVALVLGTLAYALVPNAGSAVESGTIIREAMLGGAGIVLLTSWAVSGLAATLAAGRRTSWAGTVGFLAILLLGAGAGASLFLDRQAHALAILARAAPRSIDEIMASAVRIEWLSTRYYVFVLLVLLLLGLALRNGGSRRQRISPRSLALPAVALVGVALPVAYYSNLGPLRADIALKSAEHLSERQRWPEAAAFFRRAVQLAPDEAQYWSMAARGLHEQAKQAGDDQARREEVMDEALAYAREAHLREPLHPGHVANLGRLYLWWADVTADPALKALRGGKADEYLASALEQMPNHARVWTERAVVHAQILGRRDSALAYARRAVELDARYGPPHQLLGDLYGRLAMEQADEDARARSMREAAGHYEEALRLSSSPELVNPFAVHLNASKLYAQLGETRRALEHAEAALGLAPAEERASVRALIGDLEARRGAM